MNLILKRQSTHRNLPIAYADSFANGFICAYNTQMNRRLKAADVYRTANYTRNQFRGLLAELAYQFEGDTETQPRVARTYSPHDFLVILVACELDSTMGFKRSAIAALLPAIASELSGPRPVASQPKLILTFNPPSVRYVDGVVSIEEGIVLPLTKIFTQTDNQLRQAGSDLPSPQVQLNFGPGLVSQTVQTGRDTARLLRRVRQ